MIPKLSSFARSGLFALGVIAGISAPAFAGPVAPAPFNGVAAEGAPSFLLVKEGFHSGESDCQVRGYCGDGARNGGVQNDGHSYRERRARRGSDDDGGRRHRRDRNWNQGDGGWSGNNEWRRHDRRHNRRHHRPNDYGGASFYLDLSAPSYRYVEPDVYVEPQRVYRNGLSRVHVKWCANRYRSYRAYDNSFQPNHGPRRECSSPYS